jgi:hypothetical protein
MPKEVTLNLSKDAPIPPCPLKGHQWGEIVHRPEVTWLAQWKDPITGEPKSVNSIINIANVAMPWSSCVLILRLREFDQ